MCPDAVYEHEDNLSAIINDNRYRQMDCYIVQLVTKEGHKLYNDYEKEEEERMNRLMAIGFIRKHFEIKYTVNVPYSLKQIIVKYHSK